MILALDPSLSSTGYAVLTENYNLIACGKITTKKSKKINSQIDEDNRIYKIVSNIENIIIQYDINVIPMETQFVGRNVKTAFQLSRLRGASLYSFKSLRIQTDYGTPKEIRSNLMNNGNATKEEVADYLMKFYKNNELVKALGPLNDKQCKDKNSDIYDAISIGVAYLNKIKKLENDRIQ